MDMPEELPENKIAVCYRHAEVEAVGACLACGKPLCETCGEWFNGRFYCVPCYANIEIMLAQAETPQLQNIEWYHTPGNILGIIFFSFCSMFTGFYFLIKHTPSFGILLLFLGCVIQGGTIPIIRSSPALTHDIKSFLTIFVYVSLVVVILVVLLFLLFKAI